MGYDLSITTNITKNKDANYVGYKTSWYTIIYHSSYIIKN